MNYSNTAIFAPPAGGGGAFLLDEVGVSAQTAVSFRKLSSTYSGPCIEVRRLSDNTTQDIGFDANGVLDEVAVSSFCGSSVGTIATWYDQSNNGDTINFTKADYNTPIVASEPIIYYNEGSGASITRNAGGNISAYTREPGDPNKLGLRWFYNITSLNPTLSKFTTTNILQYNAYNENGIHFGGKEPGYTQGTYKSLVQGINQPGIRTSNVSDYYAFLIQPIQANRTEPFHITTHYNTGGGDLGSKVWFGTYLNAVSSITAQFNASFPLDWDGSSKEFTFTWNAGDGNLANPFSNYVLGAFSNKYGNSNVLYPNVAYSEHIMWDLPEGTTLDATQAEALQSNINTFYSLS